VCSKKIELIKLFKLRNKTHMHLPNELIDHIIGYTDFETAVRLNNNYVSNKLYNRQTHTWN